jgi:hypothetical protein
MAKFLSDNNFIFGPLFLVGLDVYLKQVAGSPFAPHGSGDQSWPMDQSVTLYYQRTPKEETTADTDQLGRTALPLLPEPQHLVKQNAR